MSSEDLRHILQLLPLDQRYSARQRIVESLRFGWSQIKLLRLWGQMGLSHERDLIGVTPNGECRFLP